MDWTWVNIWLNGGYSDTFTEVVYYHPIYIFISTLISHYYFRCQATKSTTPDENERPKILYDVFATVNHNGFIDKGHYTANILKGGSWYTINDEFVSEAVNDNWGNENEVLCSDTAYMLFYLRRK